MLRLPSLIAGTATIPLTYLLGARSVGPPRGRRWRRRWSPSAPSSSTTRPRHGATQVMIALLLASTLALLRGVEGGGLRWWVAYAAFSCAAMYTPLHGRLRPRRPGGVGAVGAPGRPPCGAAGQPRRSPRLPALDHGVPRRHELADHGHPLAAAAVHLGGDPGFGLEHWSDRLRLRGACPCGDLPGHPALVLLGLGLLLALGALVASRLRKAAGPPETGSAAGWC